MTSLTSFVNPFIGVSGGGHVFPGATSPFGSVKLGVDTTDIAGLSIGGNNAGWSFSNVSALTYLHVSGTGGAAKYGVLSQMPTTVDINFDALNGYQSAKSGEVAEAGYYACRLDAWGVHVEMTTTKMVGIARYDFTQLSKTSHAGQVLLDLGHVLGSGQTYRGGSVQITGGRQMTGHATYRGGWNYGEDFTVHYCSQFDRPADGVGETQGLAAPSFGTWKNVGTHAGYDFESDTGDWVGGYLVYNISKNPIVTSKLGISFISSEQACQNVQDETGDSFDFDHFRRRSDKEWEKILSTIQVTDPVPPNEQVTDAQYREIFYSSLYRVHMMPSDRKGENPLWNTTAPVYDDFYTIWDTFRCSSPLLTLIQPGIQTAILESLIDIQQHEGWAPDGRAGFTSGLTQGGSNFDMIIADAYLKGLPLNWTAAYIALQANADHEPPFPEGLRKGRSRLDEYIKLGYVAQDPQAWWDGRSMSKTMEYSANDHAISLVANGLGHHKDAARYMKRSRSWRNLYDADYMHSGRRGWLRPRKPDGSWYEWNLDTSTGNWDRPTYEGNAVEYQFAASFDVQGMICLYGGPDDFVDRLDYMFESAFDPGNEPSFLSPFLYIYAGAYSKTVDRTLEILRRHYRATMNGIPGNDDSGAMGSYFVWLSLGLYPSTATDIYLISSPTFKESSIHLGHGKSIFIIADNLSRENRYIVSATLDGRKLDRAYLHDRELMNGAELVFEMGSVPSSFGTVHLPPSDTLDCNDMQAVHHDSL